MVRRRHGTRSAEAGRELLKSIEQATALVHLYRSDHPVTVAAVKGARQRLAEFLAVDGGREAVLALLAGRWMINDSGLPESPDAFRGLANAFKVYLIESVTIAEDAKAFELGILCELMAAPAGRIEESEVSAFLLKRGVRSIRVNVDRYARASARPSARQSPTRPVESPIPRKSPAWTPPSQRLGGMPFGSFVKSLVEESVSDPIERADIYAEILKTVKSSIQRRVADATDDLRRLNARAASETVRTERLLTSVADGKVVIDKDGRVLMMDAVAEEIAGKRLVELAGRPILESIGGSERVMALAADLAAPEDAPVSPEVRLIGGGEAIARYRESLAVVQDESGRVVGTYGVLPGVKDPESKHRRDELLSNVAHELKAPLASVCSALELINDGARHKLSPEESCFLDISLRNAEQLRQMIAEMLDFSKIEAGRMQVVLVASPVAPMVQEAVEGLRPWAALKGLTLTGAAADTVSDARVMGDAVRLVQVLTNLISNAIKSTPESGTITVAARPGQGQDAGSVVFSVRDTGCGIAPEHRQRIFESFTQVAPEGGRREGVGLGLTIVQDMIARHNGKLWLESEVGRGSTFSFRIPLAL